MPKFADKGGKLLLRKEGRGSKPWTVTCSDTDYSDCDSSGVPKRIVLYQKSTDRSTVTVSGTACKKFRNSVDLIYGSPGPISLTSEND